MAIRAELEGNLTRNPEGKIVTIDGEQRQIVELRVFSDVGRKVGERWEQDDERSSGVDVTIWTKSLGDAVLKHLRKGNRVLVTGAIHLNEYTDTDGAHHAGLRVSADMVALIPYRVESIAFAPPRREAEGVET
jgi:single-stranded DNA-binding protein